MSLDMIVRLPDGRVCPAVLAHVSFKPLKLTGVPDPNGEREPKWDPRFKVWTNHIKMVPPSEEDLFMHDNDLVEYTIFDASARVVEKGWYPLDYVDVLTDLFCGECGATRLGVRGDFLCVRHRFG